MLALARGCAVILAADRRRNFRIDSTQDEAEYPALSPGSGVYFLLGVIF